MNLIALEFGVLAWLVLLTVALILSYQHTRRTREAVVQALRGQPNRLRLPPVYPQPLTAASHRDDANGRNGDSQQPAASPRRPDDLVAPPPTVRGDTVRDWLMYYSNGKISWKAAVSEFYRRAALDPAIASYFADVALAALQHHFTAVMILLTSKGLTASAVRRMTLAHASVRNQAGLEITGHVYDRVVDTLVAVLVESGVPDQAINELARLIDPLRAAIVVSE